MSLDAVFQALTEAFGPLNKDAEKQVREYRKKLGEHVKKGNPKADELDLDLQALRDSFGTGVFNLNVENQIKTRVRTIAKAKEEGKEVPPAPGTGGGPAAPDLQRPNLSLFNAFGDYKGTDAGKDKKALSLVPESEDGKDLNQVQKEAFEKDGNQVKGGGTPAGPALSDVAVATNSQAGKAGGPGAGVLNR